MIDLCVSPSGEVIDHALGNLNVFTEHTKYPVAPIAKQISGDSSFMAMIDTQDIMVVRWPTADNADATLDDDFSFVFGRTKTVGFLDSPVPIVLWVSEFPLFVRFGSLLFVESCISELLGTMVDHTNPSVLFAALAHYVNFLKAAQAVSTLKSCVNFDDAMLSVDLSSASPTNTSRCVPLDGDLTTKGTDSTPIADVYSTQRMKIGPLVLSVPFEVSNGFAFYPPSVFVVSRSDGGLLCAPTVAQAIGDFASRISANAICHKNDYATTRDHKQIALSIN